MCLHCCFKAVSLCAYVVQAEVSVNVRFAELFPVHPVQGHHKGPRFISKDWIGIKPPIDAAMVGRLYVSPGPSPSPATSLSRGRTGRRKKTRGRGARVSRSLFWEDFGLDYEERFVHY